MNESTTRIESASTSTDPGAAYLDAYLQTVDYSDPTALRNAAAAIGQAAERAQQIAETLQQQTRYVSGKVRRLTGIRDELLREADYLKRRADFATARQGQTKDRRPINPEVTP